MHRTTFFAVVPLAASSLLTACASMSGGYGYGYANESNQTVTVVEHSRRGADRSTFTPKAKQLPVAGGSIAQQVEVFDAQRHKVGAFALEDYKRARHAGVPPVLVISGRGVRLASRDFWEKMAREWDGPSASEPVSFTGGDGSSIEKGIVVHARNTLDETLGVYDYIRARFGYMWMFKSMQRAWVGGEDGLYDLYEFVTRDGKKHALYFLNRKWPPQRQKASRRWSERRTAPCSHLR